MASHVRLCTRLAAVNSRLPLKIMALIITAGWKWLAVAKADHPPWSPWIQGSCTGRSGLSNMQQFPWGNPFKFPHGRELISLSALLTTNTDREGAEAACENSGRKKDLTKSHSIQDCCIIHLRSIWFIFIRLVFNAIHHHMAVVPGLGTLGGLWCYSMGFSTPYLIPPPHSYDCREGKAEILNHVLSVHSKRTREIERELLSYGNKAYQRNIFWFMFPSVSKWTHTPICLSVYNWAICTMFPVQRQRISLRSTMWTRTRTLLCICKCCWLHYSTACANRWSFLLYGTAGKVVFLMVFNSISLSCIMYSTTVTCSKSSLN